MSMTEDYTVFLNSVEHGTAAVYKTTSIVGIFENQYIEVNGVETLAPTFMIDLLSVPNIVRGNTLRINNLEYRVAGKQPDGTGMVLIILEAPN